ncbi:hypothetical protein R1flu_002945 [Riccia fluitans]|uniref:Uncharacterized protein n=1 Tax=Riccia fluitans TaxID=41844 RepID=A0ABD1Y7L5_9MARC
MEFTSVKEHEDIKELAVTAEFQVEMTGGVALQCNDIMKKTIFRLKDRHYAQILDYLETHDHFAEIWGSGRKTKVGGKNQSKAISFGHMAMELRQLGWLVLSGAAVGKKVKSSILEDEIEEVEDAASDEENDGELSGSTPEEMPTTLRSEVSPNFNKRETVEAPIYTTPPTNDAAIIALLNSVGKNVETSEAHPNVERHNKGSMAVLFQNAQKQKAEFKTTLLLVKEKNRLGMLEERKATREEEM